MVFYNTIEASGQLLIEYTEQNLKQTDIILEFFRANPGQEFTPFQVLEVMVDHGHNWPITSVRRAITDLTKIGALTMGNTLKNEKYGKPNHTWKIGKNEQQSKIPVPDDGIRAGD